LEFFSFGKKLDSAIGRGMKNPFWWPFLALSAQDVSLRDSFLMKICSLRLIQGAMSFHSGWKPIVTSPS
jgi:hypothetical protein